MYSVVTKDKKIITIKADHIELDEKSMIIRFSYKGTEIATFHKDDVIGCVEVVTLVDI